MSDHTLSTLLLESPFSLSAEPNEAVSPSEMQLSRVDAAIELLNRALSSLQRCRASVGTASDKAGPERVERRLSVLEHLEGTVEASLRRSSLLRQAILKPAVGDDFVQVSASPEPALAVPEPSRAAPPEPPPSGLVETAPPEAAPAEEPAPRRRDFLSLSHDEQIDIVWELLLGQGALDRREAVRLVAERLRSHGLARTGEDPAEAIASALQKGLQEGSFDRPRRGTVRAVLFDAKDYQPEDWQRCLLAVLGPEPAGIDETLRAAAEWARDTLGLQWTRLRTGGVILTPLLAALDELVEDEIVLRRGMTVWSA